MTITLRYLEKDGTKKCSTIENVIEFHGMKRLSDNTLRLFIIREKDSFSTKPIWYFSVK